ncbi:Nascent polypeptide-associated complex protein [Candidatus Woesearchaeota archaeon]|nr:Nascent polypeptide-associated complex protein [Candidatus Woesearchaeota archaeon]
MNLRPQDMAKALKRMGIASTDLSVVEVIFRCEDKDIVIQQPQVTKVNMMGQETYQVVGKAIDKPRVISISQEDVDTVVAQTGATAQDARLAIEKHQGDLAAAILDLKP